MGGEADERLSFHGLKRLGLYVHIPFCKTVCGFCQYCKAPYESGEANRYAEALVGEIKMIGEQCAGIKEARAYTLEAALPRSCTDISGRSSRL
ncbi:MAG: hypothetical protein LBT81_04915 [Helicobacteraceae bacterium]|jgi:oxygen-independent coproporphyrinogen-3 oxidase|nr:hypothetical protein [Helicobacteraceae bacterium]